MIDSTHLKAHRTAASLLKGGTFPRQIGRTRVGLNSKLHAICDGKPVVLLLTAGQVSDYRGADTVLDALPEADVLIADKGYDSNRLRKALAKQGIKSCIPGRAKRKEPIIYDTELYESRNLIERLFGRLKDWRRIAIPVRSLCAYILQCHLSCRHGYLLVMSPEPRHALRSARRRSARRRRS